MKSKANKKSVKKAPARKKSVSGKKKPVQKSAKKSRHVSGKKSSSATVNGHPISDYNKAVRDCMEIQKGLGHEILDLLLRGFPKRDIQVVIQYRSVGGVVDQPIRGQKPLRGMK
ncbi:MAG: hypothetical protein CMF59_16695 [Leptospiraceae bacterium]|nr:hypothetical protein [Leptospiraceae bacterium]